MRIAIIDDTSSSRDTLKNMLSRNDNFNIVGESSKGDDFERLFVGENVPDIIFLDKKFGSNWTKGFDIAPRIKARHPEVKIILITEFAEPIEFADIHSTQLLDGYIRQSSVINEDLLTATIYGAITGNPLWDVPGPWLTYKISDDLLPKYRNKFAKENEIKEEDVKDSDEEFLLYLRDEKCRTSAMMTDTEWIIFKMTAMGYNSSEISKVTNVKNLNTHNLHIRSKIGYEGNSNQAVFLIKALEFQIPEVIDKVSALANCNIRFSE